MRKLKLSELNLGSAEVLTREELRKVLGGSRFHVDSYCGTANKCSSKTCYFQDGSQGTCGTYGGNTPTKTCGCIGGGLGS